VDASGVANWVDYPRSRTISLVGAPGSDINIGFRIEHNSLGRAAEGTLRWRVGYKAQAVSLRERVTERIPLKWRVRLRPLTERLSNKEAEHEITSAVFECPHNEPPVVDGGIPARFSFESPWPAATEAGR
jgi:hypothetical protein